GEVLGRDGGEVGLAEGERALDANEVRSLRTPPGNGCALGRGVVRHWLGIIAAKMFAFDVIPAPPAVGGARTACHSRPGLRSEGFAFSSVFLNSRESSQEGRGALARGFRG